MQQGFSEGPEPSASSEGSQSAVEAEAEVEQGGEEESVRVSRTDMRSPRSF